MVYQWKSVVKIQLINTWIKSCSTVPPIKCLNLWALIKWWDRPKWLSFRLKLNKRWGTIKGSIKLLIHCKMIYMLINFLLMHYKKKFPLPVWCQISTGTDRTMTMSHTCPLYQVLMNIQTNMVIGLGISQATTTNRIIEVVSETIRSMFTHRPYQRPAPLLKAQTRRRTQTTSLIR